MGWGGYAIEDLDRPTITPPTTPADTTDQTAMAIFGE